MKLRKLNYTDPKTKGQYAEMFVEERINGLDGEEKYLSIGFKMYFLENGIKKVVAESFMPFKGGDGDPDSTNQTMMGILEGETEAVPLLPVIVSNGGTLPANTQITEIGYPHFDDVQGYFTGGSIQSPRIVVDNPLSQLFILKKCILNGDTLENQGFEFVE